MRRSALVLLLAGIASGPARAQQPPPAAPPAPRAPDSGRVVLDRVLGGDSTQAATLELRRGAVYRVEVRPARAVVTVRRRGGGSTAPPLDTILLPRGDSLLGWRTFGVVARDGGEHVAELTNPGIGATTVRVSLVRRALDDSAPSTARRTLVANVEVTPAPSYVTLDSGVVYRFVIHPHGDVSYVYLAPRSMYRPPLRIAPLIRGGGSGVPVIPDFTGDYKLSTDSSSASVQVYREEADPQEIACIRDPHGPGCRGTRPHLSTRGLIVLILAIPTILIVDKVFR